VFLPNDLDVPAEPYVISVLNPFDIFHALYNQCPEQFQLSMLGDLGNEGLGDFWREAMKEEWACEHPVVQRHLHKLNALIPLTYHMDGAEVHRNSEYFFLTVGNPLVQYAQTHSLDAKFCLSAISHAIMKIGGAMHRIMHELARWLDWCHHVMELGELPRTGFYGEHFSKSSLRGKSAGEPIMGEYLGIYMGTKADGKARVPFNIHIVHNQQRQLDSNVRCMCAWLGCLSACDVMADVMAGVPAHGWCHGGD